MCLVYIVTFHGVGKLGTTSSDSFESLLDYNGLSLKLKQTDNYMTLFILLPLLFTD